MFAPARFAAAPNRAVRPASMNEACTAMRPAATSPSASPSGRGKRGMPPERRSVSRHCTTSGWVGVSVSARVRCSRVNSRCERTGTAVYGVPARAAVYRERISKKEIACETPSV